MKKRMFLLLAMALFALHVHAQNVWSAKIDTFGNYANSNANVVSIFTPATAITVNRIQLQAAGGQVCTVLPGIRVTDGTTSYSLAIPNTKAKGGIGPATNDSGVISLAFSANKEIAVKAIPSSSGCNP